MATQDFGKAIVEQTLHSWAARDLDGAVRHMADGVVHSLNIDGSLAPYVASAAGKANVKAKLGLILDEFWFERFEITSMQADAAGVRTVVGIRYRHKKTDEVLTARIRFFFKLRNDSIVLLEETHDAQQIESFIRMVGNRTKTAG